MSDSSPSDGSAAGSWSIVLHVRQDAPSAFVPADEMPDARVGDAVTLVNPDHAESRTGRVTGVTEDPDRGTFFTVELE